MHKSSGEAVKHAADLMEPMPSEDSVIYSGGIVAVNCCSGNVRGMQSSYRAYFAGL